MALQTQPNLREELRLYNSGYAHIAGVDESGRGAWAGPVCAAAVVLPVKEPNLRERLGGVNDSKLLSAARREALLPAIYAAAKEVGVGWATPAEVDEVGVVQATKKAMVLAVEALTTVDALLIDYVRLPGLEIAQRSLPKADSLCLSVAAASIVAKVERDRLMTALHDDFPAYGFAHHKGYGTRKHRMALVELGPSPIHRLSWRPVRELRENLKTWYNLPDSDDHGPQRPISR